jgi:hypothetical protein
MRVKGSPKTHCRHVRMAKNDEQLHERVTNRSVRRRGIVVIPRALAIRVTHICDGCPSQNLTKRKDRKVNYNTEAEA